MISILRVLGTDLTIFMGVVCIVCVVQSHSYLRLHDAYHAAIALCPGPDNAPKSWPFQFDPITLDGKSFVLPYVLRTKPNADWRPSRAAEPLPPFLVRESHHACLLTARLHTDNRPPHQHACDIFDMCMASLDKKLAREALDPQTRGS